MYLPVSWNAKATWCRQPEEAPALHYIWVLNKISVRVFQTGHDLLFLSANHMQFSTEPKLIVLCHNESLTDTASSIQLSPNQCQDVDEVTICEWSIPPAWNFRYSYSISGVVSPEAETGFHSKSKQHIVYDGRRLTKPQHSFSASANSVRLRLHQSSRPEQVLSKT